MSDRTALYPRVLRLRHVHPNAWQRAALGEGAIAVAGVLVLADLATAWSLLVLPVAVAAVVKAHDVVAGVLARGDRQDGDVGGGATGDGVAHGGYDLADEPTGLTVGDSQDDAAHEGGAYEGGAYERAVAGTGEDEGPEDAAYEDGAYGDTDSDDEVDQQGALEGGTDEAVSQVAPHDGEAPDPEALDDAREGRDREGLAETEVAEDLDREGYEAEPSGDDADPQATGEGVSEEVPYGQSPEAAQELTDRDEDGDAAALLEGDEHSAGDGGPVVTRRRLFRRSR